MILFEVGGFEECSVFFTCLVKRMSERSLLNQTQPRIDRCILTLYRCLRNCGWRTIVEEAIELKLKIKSSPVSLLSIQWSVTPPIDWQRDSGTGNNRQTLSIYENVLQTGRRYNISVQGEWVFKTPPGAAVYGI